MPSLGEISFFSTCYAVVVESQRLGQSSFTLPVGTGGLEMGEEVIRWNRDYSAWELFALETCQIFHTPGVGTGNDNYQEREREGEMHVSYYCVLVYVCCRPQSKSSSGTSDRDRQACD